MESGPGGSVGGRAVSAMAPRWNQEREGHHMLIPYWGRPSQPWPGHCPRDPETHTPLCKAPALESRDLRSDSRLLRQPPASVGRAPRRLPEQKLKRSKNVNSPHHTGASVRTRARPSPLRGRGGWPSSGSPAKATGVTACGPGAARPSIQDAKSPGAGPRRGRALTLVSGQPARPPPAVSPSPRDAVTGAAHSPRIRLCPPVSACVRLCLHGQAQPPKDRGPDEVAGALTRDRHQPSPLLSVSSLRGRTAVNGKP